MMVVVLLYRTNLPYSVKTCPWCLRTNILPKPLEDLQLLLLTEHRLASGQALELEDEFGSLAPELILDLVRHPVQACGYLLLISTLEPDARALLDLRLYDNGAVGHPHRRHASNNILLVFEVAEGSETQRKRYGIPEPVTLVNEGMLW